MLGKKRGLLPWKRKVKPEQYVKESDDSSESYDNSSEDECRNYYDDLTFGLYSDFFWTKGDESVSIEDVLAVNESSSEEESVKATKLRSFFKKGVKREEKLSDECWVCETRDEFIDDTRTGGKKLPYVTRMPPSRLPYHSYGDVEEPQEPTRYVDIGGPEDSEPNKEPTQENLNLSKRSENMKDEHAEQRQDAEAVSTLSSNKENAAYSDSEKESDSSSSGIPTKIVFESNDLANAQVSNDMTSDAMIAAPSKDWGHTKICNRFPFYDVVVVVLVSSIGILIGGIILMLVSHMNL